MLKPILVDQEAIDVEDKVISKKLEAIERLQDEIHFQFDTTTQWDLKDIERIERNNKANDSENLQPDLKLNYLASVKRDWLIKSRKKAQKEFVKNWSLADRMRLDNMIDKSLVVQTGGIQ